MIYVIVLTVIAGTLGLYFYFLKNLNPFKKHGIPYKTPFPLFGNMGPLIFGRESFVDLMKKIYNLHPEAKYVGMFDLDGPVTVLRDPELINSITVKNFDLFPDHPTLIDENQEPLITNLFTLKGERWRHIRNFMNPAFTSSKMKSMFKLMSDYAAEFSNYLTQMPVEKRTMDTKDVFTRYTNDVIATCAFGISVDSMKNPKNEFYVYGKEATTLNSIFFLKIFVYRRLPWLAKIFKMRVIREQIADYFRNVIENTIKTREENSIVRPDILQLLIEAGNKEDKKLSITNMISVASIFFFGGFESTSTLMCFVAHEVAVNPEIQKKLQNEIDQVLEESNGEAPYEMVINNMRYLDAVISESLRMYPVAAGTNRVCLKEFELPPTLPGMKPFIIKKEEAVWIPTYELHHDPQYFEEPEKFSPERFLGERKKEILKSGAYLPFGLGPRICIGKRFALIETKVLLFHLLARNDLNICEKTPLPLKMAKGFTIMKPEGGFWLNVSPRKTIHHTIATNAINGTHHL